MVKKLYIIVSFLLLTACSRSGINPTSYTETTEFLSDNFEISYKASDNKIPDYLDGYDVRNISQDITMALNASEEIVYLGFKNMTLDETEIILDEINFDKDEEIELLLTDPENFREKHGQSYLVYDLDNVIFHILDVNNAFSGKIRTEEPYNINLFYNKHIYDDFS